ncbi:AEC family transporter [Methylonatrum kenyense]|uniref:AEC family transporter n=1 Tax=Methylonatrum kenyense TaxID=455253 RepID=UPI0020BE6BB7|nr:AEC family transporter [Methylonatrum kenyense]MCK8515478.1 AEC family transporter [Methylonatrum kenyense]
MTAALFNVVTPVLLCIAVGWVWARQRRPFDTRGMADLITLVGTPCLIFSTLTGVPLPADELWQMALATLFSIAAFGLIGLAVLAPMRLPFRTYLPPLMFANIGNMGLPLCLFAFGDEGLALAIVVLAVFSAVNFTLGIWLYAGSGSASHLWRQPMILATAVAVAFLLADLQPPVWLESTTALLGAFTIPLMLVMLGVSLARLRVTRLPRALWLSLVRIGGGVLVGVLIAEALQMEGVARGVLILQSAMPVAVFNYLFAVRYNRDPETTAGLVVVSTVLSVLTLPPLLFWLMG